MLLLLLLATWSVSGADDPDCEVFPFGKPPEHTAAFCKGVPPSFNAFRDVDLERVPDELTEHCPEELPSMQPSWFGAVGQTTRAFFKNEADHSVELFWVDDSGREHSKGKISPGHVANHVTFEGHIFHARALAQHGSKLLLRHRVGLFAFANPMGLPCSDSKPVERKNHDGCPLLCNYIHRGFVNRVGCDIDLWYWNGTGEEQVQQLGTQPGVNFFGAVQANEATYLTHVFRARMPDGRLVQERQIDRVYIKDCSNGASSENTHVRHAVLIHSFPSKHIVNSTELNESENSSLEKDCSSNVAVREASLDIKIPQIPANHGAVACFNHACSLSPLELSRLAAMW